DELESLIQRHFGAYQLLGQKLAFHSAIWSLTAAGSDAASAPDGASSGAVHGPVVGSEDDSLESVSHSVVDRVGFDQIKADRHQIPDSINQPAMYFIALCAEAAENLPPSDHQLWLCDDFDESVYQHYHGEIGRNIAAGG